MTLPLTRLQASQALHSAGFGLPVSETSANRRALYKRAAYAKQQFETEQQFHRAAREIRDSADPVRLSYLNWILEHMFSLFDYHSGLQAIRDDSAYQEWCEINGLLG